MPNWVYRGVAALLLSNAGCAREAVPSGASERGERPKIQLLAHDAEVWAWKARVAGELVGTGTLEACVFEVNGVATPAAVQNLRFSAELALNEGPNRIRARCRERGDGDLETQPVNYVVRLTNTPRARATASLNGTAVLLDGSATTPSERSRAKVSEYVWFTAQGVELGRGERLELATPPSDAQSYELRVRDEQGRSDVARALAPNSASQTGASASWIDDAVMYGIVPAFYGKPALPAVRAQLEALHQLGVTALWLSPIFGTPPDDFGYAVTDYFTVRQDYGTGEDLKALVAAAHAKNIRVILDLVPNHTSVEHPYFQAAERARTWSHYFPFYDRDAKAQPTHYFDWEHLPNLNYDNEEVHRWMNEVSSHWINAYGVDGYRVDAAWGIRQRRPEFWPSWAAELRRVAPDVLLLAEASARDPFYVQHGFDAAYDWTEELGHWAWERVFVEPQGIARRLHEAVQATTRATSRPERVLRFINNNDTGPRFITRYGEPMTRVAAAALLTLPGLPCLYTLDEVGAAYEPYAGLNPVAFEPKLPLREYYRTLIALRRSTPALRAAGFVPVHSGERDELYAYVRHTPDKEQWALVLLNFGAAPVEATITLPEPWQKQGKLALVDRMGTRAELATAGKLAVKLEPWATRVLTPR